MLPKVNNMCRAIQEIVASKVNHLGFDTESSVSCFIKVNDTQPPSFVQLAVETTVYYIFWVVDHGLETLLPSHILKTEWQFTTT